MKFLFPFFLLFLCITKPYSQLAKPVVTIENLSIDKKKLLESNQLDIICKAIKIDTGSFRNWYPTKECKLVVRLYTKDGSPIFDGSVAPSGSFNIDFLFGIDNITFEIPFEEMTLSGQQDLSASFIVKHYPDGYEHEVGSFPLGEILIPEYSVMYWKITELSIPHSSYHDPRIFRFLYNKSNGDLAASFVRDGETIRYTKSYKNSQKLGIERVRVVSFEHSNWEINAVDVDIIGRHDLIATFPIGQIDSIEKGVIDMESGSSTLSASYQKVKEPKVKWYSNHLEVRHMISPKGLGGVAVVLKGSKLSTLLGPWYHNQLFVAGIKVDTTNVLYQSDDSVVYFYPYFKLPNVPIYANWMIKHYYDNSLAAQYVTKQCVTPPPYLRENTFSNPTVQTVKRNGRMDLQVTVHHSMPKEYLPDLETQANIGDIQMASADENTRNLSYYAESDLVYYCSLYKLDSFTAFPIEFTSTHDESGVKRICNSLADTIRNVPLNLETLQIRIFCKGSTSLMSGARWCLRMGNYGETVSAQNITSEYTDFVIRKHPNDDLMLELKYLRPSYQNSIETKSLNVPFDDRYMLVYPLTITSKDLEIKKGKKRKLKKMKGMDECYFIRL